MSLSTVFKYEGKFDLKMPQTFVNRYPHIGFDPNIHSGRPHIKGTRILATDIFKANVVKGYSLDKIRMEFKEMGIDIEKKILEEAIDFTISMLEYLRSEKEGK